MISPNFGRLPYINIPTRYIFAASQAISRTARIRSTMAVAIWINGGRRTETRSIMMIGANSGKRERPTDSALSGLLMIKIRSSKGRIKNMVIGMTSC